MLKKIIAFITLYFLSISCFGLFDAGSRDITAGYELSWIDLPEENQFINNKSGEGVISSHVYAVGFNNNFIIAKQYPKTKNFVHRNKTNYFIIEVRKGNIIGPINKNAFEKKRRELKIDDIKFITLRLIKKIWILIMKIFNL